MNVNMGDCECFVGFLCRDWEFWRLLNSLCKGFSLSVFPFYEYDMQWWGPYALFNFCKGRCLCFFCLLFLSLIFYRY